MKSLQLLSFLFVFLVGTSFAEPENSDRVKVLTFDEELIPDQIEIKGKVIAGRRWRDKNGLNFLIFSVTEQRGASQHSSDPAFTKRLKGTHLVIEGETHRVVREINDFVQNCEFDLTMELLKSSIYISDLDQDGIAEATFVYRLGCRSDVSPLDLKLLMLEDGEKYAIRGTAIIADYGGQEKIDPSFQKAPKAFLDFAENHWKLFVYEF